VIKPVPLGSIKVLTAAFLTVTGVPASRIAGKSALPDLTAAV
jgi:hypothetical protein